MDFLECENSDVYQWVEFNQEVQWLKKAIECKLDGRERKVIALRYGLYGGNELTQMEIARLMKISRSYVSRIEKKAIQKLREGMDTK